MLYVEGPDAFLYLLLSELVELVSADKVDDVGGLIVLHDVQGLGGS